MGCWQQAAAPSGAGTPLMCGVPAAGTSAVDIMTVTDGKITAHERVDATGQRIVTAREGCTGWESASWSGDAERVYLHSDYSCGNGVRRETTSLIAMSANGEWLDVQGLTSGKNSGVRVNVYREASNPANLPPEITAALGNRSLAMSAARSSAASPLNLDDIAEASHHLDAPVVEAWLANRGDVPAVDGDQLVQLANAGVPGRVLDVLVAMSYPNKFAIRPAGQGQPGAYGDAVAPGRLNGVVGSTAGDSTRAACPYSAFGWDYYNNCAYSPYAYSMWGNPYGYYSTYGYYSPYSNFGYGYGYGGYGYGGYGYGGWYPGAQPVVVVVNPNQGAHGRVVKGRGYVQGQGQSTGSSGPRGSWAPSSGGGSSSGSSGSAGSSAGSSGGRTAHRTRGGGR